MSYIIPIGNGSFVSAKNGWFSVSCAVTRESLGYYSWIMVGYRVPRYLTGNATTSPHDERTRGQRNKRTTRDDAIWRDKTTIRQDDERVARREGGTSRGDTTTSR